MKNVLIGIRSLILWGLGLSVFFIGAVTILLTGLFSSGPLLYRVMRMSSRAVLGVMGIRVVPRGLENRQGNTAFIVMMNHVNLLDPFVFLSHFRGEVVGIEEQSHFSWPLYGWLIKRIGQIPIDRKNAIKARRSLDRAREVSRTRSVSIIILPEGSRSRTGKLGPFKRGGFILARETGLPILPIIQRGGYRIKKPERWLIRPGKIEYIMEKPIHPEDESRETAGELMARTRKVFTRYLNKTP